MLKTKFRVTKCLYAAMKDEPETIQDFAITEDGKKHRIQTTRDGIQYFTIDNPYKTDLLGKSFIHCIGDAVKSILEDYADCMLSGSHENVFTSYDFPIVLIDRTLGEQYHAQAKEGFKDSEFGYRITLGGRYSFGGYAPLDENGHSCFFEGTPKVYDTKEAAQEQMDTWLNEAKSIAEEFITADENRKKELMNKHSWDAVETLWTDMINEDETALVEDINNLPHIGWSIEQCFKNTAA